MNWKNRLFTLLAIIGLVSCNNSSENNLENNFSISGKIDQGGGKRIYLEAMSANGTIDVAQSETESDGSFVLEGNLPAMGIYQLRLGEDDLHVLPVTLSPDEKITLKASYDTYSTLPNFSGAAWTQPMNKYMSLFNDFANQQAELAQSSQGQMDEEQMMNQYLQLRKPLDDYAEAQMLKDPGNPVNIILITSLSPSLGFKKWDVKNLETYEKVVAGFSKKHPNSPITKDIEAQYEQLKMSYAQFQEFEKTQSGGAVTPEIALQNPEGKMVRLSDLRGKYVLIDFWASWCRPCRQENPNVVRLYNQYKNKNFTVFSVSLDQNAEAWKGAILADGLIWPNHVSDLKAWDTPLTKLYGFNSIPHTVLIDKQGKVIARDLRGESLEQKLKEVL